MLTHILVRDCGYYGSWGRGPSLEFAMKNYRKGGGTCRKIGKKLKAYKVDAEAYIDDYGTMHFLSRQEINQAGEPIGPWMGIAEETEAFAQQ